MDRSFATLEVRSVDDELRIVEGIANSDSVDSHGTVIEPEGAVFTLPIPLFWHHDQEKPVGHVIASKVIDGKRWATIQIKKIADDGTEGGREVKRRVDSAWADIKNGLVTGLSIDFVPITPPSKHAKRWTKWRWMGLSGVSLPSNADATVLSVRSAFAASGDSSPGVSGTQTIAKTSIPKRTMTTSEQIQAYEVRKADLAAQKDALLDAVAMETRGFTPEETTESDTIDNEIRSIDAQIARLNARAATVVASATPVVARTLATASASRAGEVVHTVAREVPKVHSVKANVEPGIGMARYVMALYQANGDKVQAEAIARRNWPDQADEIGLQLRAAVAAGNTTDATWASPLVQPTTIASEFLEMLRPRTLLGRIPNLAEVPFNVRVAAQTGAGTYNWVGEGRPKPLTALAFSAVTLGHNKVAGIIAITDELLRFSNPKAEERIRNDMLAGIPRFLDGQFVDPAITATAGVRPASITNGIAGTAASGTTEAAARTDLRALIGGFDTTNYELDGVVLLMTSSTAFALGTMVNALGQPAFPGLGIDGGRLMGVPVVTSNAPALSGQIIAIHAPSILIADDENVTIDMSREASVEMESTPTNPLTATVIMTSLWQHNMVGFRAERFVTWLRARSDAVRRIHTVAYA